MEMCNDDNVCANYGRIYAFWDGTTVGDFDEQLCETDDPNGSGLLQFRINHIALPTEAGYVEPGNEIVTPLTEIDENNLEFFVFYEKVLRKGLWKVLKQRG